ncbi:MAG: hypothetical protein BGO52_22060 [Sphingobacteriales bacterium 44-61]|nr:MAG: hypothetical protein BGO52_22060 [Sphingobacteriales bacterium 44-61]
MELNSTSERIKIFLLYYICPVKKWAAIIFLFLAMAGTFYPCCPGDDDCATEADQTSTHSGSQKEDNCFCSPFSACASCAASEEISAGNFNFFQLKPLPARYSTYIFTNGEEVYSSLFQPPRYC